MTERQRSISAKWRQSGRDAHYEKAQTSVLSALLLPVSEGIFPRLAVIVGLELAFPVVSDDVTVGRKLFSHGFRRGGAESGGSGSLLLRLP